jgi:hypothetical protein
MTTFSGFSVFAFAPLVPVLVYYINRFRTTTVRGNIWTVYLYGFAAHIAVSKIASVILHRLAALSLGPENPAPTVLAIFAGTLGATAAFLVLKWRLGREKRRDSRILEG